MAPTPKAYRAKDGAISYAVRFRLAGSSNPVKETFGPFNDDPDGAKALAAASRFARVVGEVGGDAARAQRRQGEDSARTMPTLRTWLDAYLEGVAAHAAQGTAPEYRRMAERTFLPMLGSLPLDAIDRGAVLRWVAWQREQETARSASVRARARAQGHAAPEPVKVSAKSIRNAHGLLSAALGAAVDAELIVRNVARKVPLPSDEASTEKEVLTDTEWTALRDALPEYWRPLVTFLLVTGARFGEATAVQVRDLDLTATTPTVRIRRAWKKAEAGVYLGAPKSRRSRRTVRIGPALATMLAPLVEGRDAASIVFVSAQGQRVQAQHFRERVWLPALAKAGITKHVTPHSLRHTSASWQLWNGVAPQVVQHRLGHESLATTSKVYAHLMTDEQADAAAVLDAAARPQTQQIAP